jgi:hypothetical protein
VNQTGRELIVRSEDEPRATISEFADLLRSFERSLGSEPPERIVLADDSDTALAAALVATKLLIPLDYRFAANSPASVNGRLIAQLAAA